MKYDLSEITDLIRNRRTIYPEQYSPRVVQREMVEHILTNATWAPTHGKTQPWRFKVYAHEGRNQLIPIVDQLYRAHTSEEDFNDKKLERLQTRIGASSVVIVMAMKRTEDTKIPEMEEIMAVACAGQNILLTAAAYGLGVFWSTPKFIYTPEATEAFGFDSGDKILGLIYLGYPVGEWPKGHRRPLEYVTEWVEENA